MYIYIYSKYSNTQICCISLSCSFGDRGGNPHHNATARHLYLSTSPLQAAYRSLFPNSNVCQNFDGCLQTGHKGIIYANVWLPMVVSVGKKTAFFLPAIKPSSLPP